MKYNNYKTAKGTELPLINLKGKNYMMVAHRLIWFTEEVLSYTTSTEFLVLTENETVARVTVNILGEESKLTGIKSVVKSVTATKREDKKGFADHTEKAETGALGRALALLGYGTQFAVADLEEGDRLADSPVIIPTENKTTVVSVSSNKTESVPNIAMVEPPKKFSRSKPVVKSNSDDLV